MAEGPASTLSCDSLPVEVLGRPLFAALLEGELPLKAVVALASHTPIVMLVVCHFVVGRVTRNFATFFFSF